MAAANAATEREDALETIAAKAGGDSDDEDDNVTTATVKMKLNQFVADPALRRKIDLVVSDMNQLLAETYLFANIHIAWLIEKGKELPKIDRNFYYRCLLATGTPSKKIRKDTLPEDMVVTSEMFHNLRPNDLRRVDVSDHNQLIADLSITMATMATNHLLLNLEKRIEGYLKWRHPEFRGLWKTIVTATVNPRLPLDHLFTPKANATEAVALKFEGAKRVAGELRQLLGFRTARKTKSVAHLTLPLYRRILIETEAAVKQRKAAAADAGPSTSSAKRIKQVRCRPFTLLPLKNGFTVSHIPISSMTFIRMIRDREKITGDGRNEDHRRLWEKYCNVNLVETKVRKFAERIVTDGCGVSVLLSKKTCLCCNGSGSHDLTPAEFRVLMHEKDLKALVRAVDPGFNDVVTFTGLDGKSGSYSSARYYERAKFNASRRCTDRWNDHTKELVASLPSHRTASVEGLTVYAAAYLKILRTMIDHRMSMGYRNMRFMRHVFRDKAIEEICEFVAPKDKICVVGFGDWSGGQGSCVKRRTCGPIEEIKHRLSQRSNVVLRMISEFRSSQNCSCCWQKLSNMRADVTSKRKNGTVVTTKSKVHKVLHCRSSVDSGIIRCGATWNRDINASKNLLMLTMHEMYGFERPEPFRRPARRRRQ